MIHEITMHVHTRITFQWNDQKTLTREEAGQIAASLAINSNMHTIENGVQVTRVETDVPKFPRH